MSSCQTCRANHDKKQTYLHDKQLYTKTQTCLHNKGYKIKKKKTHAFMSHLVEANLDKNRHVFLTKRPSF